MGNCLRGTCSDNFSLLRNSNDGIQRDDNLPEQNSNNAAATAATAAAIVSIYETQNERSGLCCLSGAISDGTEDGEGVGGPGSSSGLGLDLDLGPTYYDFDPSSNHIFNSRSNSGGHLSDSVSSAVMATTHQQSITMPGDFEWRLQQQAHHLAMPLSQFNHHHHHHNHHHHHHYQQHEQQQLDLLSEEDQIKIAKRIGLIQFLPIGLYDGPSPTDQDNENDSDGVNNCGDGDGDDDDGKQKPPLHQRHYRRRDTECDICMVDFQQSDMLRYLPCMHKYHVKCIDDWLMRSLTCPNCLEPVDSALLTSMSFD